MRKFFLIVWINVLLFGLTPFLHCGAPPSQEPPPADSNTPADSPPDTQTVDTNKPTDTPPTTDTPPADDGSHKPNTPYKEPEGSSIPKDAFEIKASGFDVPASAEEKRICYVFDAPVTEDRLLHRFEPLVANTGLVKQIILNIDDGEKKDPWDCTTDKQEGVTPIYVWLPGMENFQFPPKSGVLLPAGKRIRLILHVLNQTQQPVAAASGLKVYHIPKDGKAYKLWSNPVVDFSIRPGKSLDYGNICELQQPVEMLAGTPLMGTYGTRFISELIRPNGTREELMFVENWSTKTYWRMFSFPFQANKGDTLSTTCSWRNPSEQEVKEGWRSQDEMCNLLLYIDAPTNSTKDICGQQINPAYKPPPINYKPDKCAPTDGLTTAKDVEITTSLNSELDVNFGYQGGEWVKADWELIGGEITFSSALIGNLLQKEFTLAAGQVRTGDQFHIDIVIQAIIALGDDIVRYPFPITASGTPKMGQTPGSLSVDVTCGEFKHDQMTYKIEGNQLRIGVIVTATTQIGAIKYGLKLQFAKKQ